MRLKLLLFGLILASGIVSAQNDTIQGLLITEAKLEGGAQCFFEITNVGDESVNLNVIEFGEMRPWGQPPWEPDATRRFMLPDYVLEPGEVFVIGGAKDWEPKLFARGVPRVGEKGVKDEIWDLADMLVHVLEVQSAPGDSVWVPGSEMFNDIYGGRSCFFIRQHINETDSVVLDQVNGWFDGDNGLNDPNGRYDIAGVSEASNNSIIIRKANVKQGNLDFANAAGIGEDDGEWIAVPTQGGVWRDMFWTLGNHGSYVLDENTLESDIADVDFANKTITVPWGTRRGDGVMHLMTKKPGIAWNYHLSPAFEDSLTFAATTGDILEVMVCGDKVHRAMFDIIAAPPTSDATTIVPVSNMDPAGNWRGQNEAGADALGWPRITAHGDMDTIWGQRGGIPYATRVDSLMLRIAVPSNATYEFVWVDGVTRVDLKDGDKLKINAENGSSKEYHISVIPARLNDNAQLSAITWPDIPEFYKGIFGWIGDTIPNFGAGVKNYRLTVPLDVDGIPGLVAKPEDDNAKIDVTRAKNLTGTLSDRTITFQVTAEDDTTFRFYNVELVKEKNPQDLQPFYAEPFMSEYIFQERWSNNYVEIVNPGNQPLDLSNYMVGMQGGNSNPADLITGTMLPEDWLNRFNKYIPGYKWVGEAQWQVTPGILEQDLNVNPIVQPGDVFAMGGIGTDGDAKVSWSDWVWQGPLQCDVLFRNFVGSNYTFLNPWGEEVDGMPLGKWCNSNWFMFKILNDSIKQGLKPANDPNDFELIESFGMADGSTWIIGGVNPIQSPNNQIFHWIRKPHISEGNTTMEESFGTNEEDSEWIGANDKFYQNERGIGWPFYWYISDFDLGKHFMFSVTSYQSTISSVVYKVSEGYSMKESIKGMTPGVTASGFLADIIKADEGQTLTLKAFADGSELTGDVLISNMDTLIVLSADSVNTSKYILEVSEEGLSSNAVLTSTRYDITITSQPKSATEEGDAGAGEITGFEYGTSIRTVLANITVPAGASMDIVDADGAYIPLKRLNFDTTYVNVTVNSNTYFDVTAENSTTRIVYQLIPDATESDAFITSDVYEVLQKDAMIKFVPRGISVSTFVKGLVPSPGATVTLVDKLGLTRTDGYVADDDKIVVTSSNMSNTKTYFINKLATENTPVTTYFAYINSDVYAVNQVNNAVNQVSTTTTIAEFLSNITPAEGAMATVIDANDTEKTSGDINRGDRVMVVAADNKTVAYYTFGQLTGVDVVDSGNIELYPNPTTGKINISGLELGNRIQVFNATGANILNAKVQNNIEAISIANEPAGMYMIVISDNEKLIGKYKAIKR